MVCWCLSVNLADNSRRMTSIALHPENLHGSLIEALKGPDPERALEQAFIQLSRGGHMSLLLAMIKALVRAGLAGIAARLLRASGGLLAAEPQLTALANQLESMPSGEVSPQILSARRTANLLALEQRCPLIAATIKQCRYENIRIFCSAKGNLHASRDDAHGKLEFVFPFVDQIFHASAAKLEPPAVGGAFLLMGVPSAPLWKRLCSLRADNGFVPPIDVIEPDPAIFHAWLGLIETSDGLSEERVSFFIGGDALQEYRQFLLDHPTRQMATHTITSIRPRWQPPKFDAAIHDHITRVRQERHADLKKRLDLVYAGKDVVYWRHRLSEAGRKAQAVRVVGLTSRFSTVMQHAMRDLASAFRRHGCALDVIKQSADHIGSVDVVGELHRLKPEMIIVINHARFELADSIPANVPYVCWIQDYMQPLWSRNAGASIAEFDLVLGHSPAVMTSVYGYPADRFIATNNLTSTDIFSADPVPESDKREFLCDLSYIGHGWESPEQLVDEAAGQNPRFGAYMNDALRLARRRLEHVGHLTTQDLVAIILQAEQQSEHPPLTPELRRSLVVPFVQRIIDRVLRHQTLHWAAEWAIARGKRFRIFGNGWERHPTLRQFACGPVEHGYPLRCAYQASTISLQVNGYGSLHQRLLDGLASGCCMVTRFNPADFVRNPHLTIQRHIKAHHIDDLRGLMRHAEADAGLRQAMLEAETYTGTRIAPADDPVRARHVTEHVQCASLDESDFSDEGLFRVLRELLSIPHRAAGDIDGFASTTFTSKQQMHELLDRLTDDHNWRCRITSCMRQSVLQHDTYDTLVRKILSAWSIHPQTKG